MKKFILIIGLLIIPSFLNATDYYVRKGAGKLSVWNDGSDWYSAWDDFNDISGLSAGDTVYIAAGTYKGSCVIDASGTSDNERITIKRATINDHGTDLGWVDSYDGMVDVDVGWIWMDVGGRHHITIDGVDRTKFLIHDGGYGISGKTPGQETYKITVKNLTIYNMQGAGIRLYGYGSTTDTSSCKQGFEIANNEIFEFGADGHDDSNKGGIVLHKIDCLNPPTEGRNKIYGNYIHSYGMEGNKGTSFDGITGHISWTDIYNNTFDNDDNSRASTDSVRINGKEVNIYNNFFEAGIGTLGHMIYFTTWYPPYYNLRNNKVYNNLLYRPIGSTQSVGIMIIKHPDDGTTDGDIDGISIYNNTIYGLTWPIYYDNKGGSNDIRNVNIKNNILHGVEFSVFSVSGKLDECLENYGCTLDHNYYVSDGSRNIISIGSTYTFEQAQGAGWEMNGGVGDPKFNSIGRDGFYPTSFSPAIVKSGGVDFSYIFNFDKNGNSRISGSWGLGAYSFSVVPPPTNLTIIEVK